MISFNDDDGWCNSLFFEAKEDDETFLLFEAAEVGGLFLALVEAGFGCKTTEVGGLTLAGEEGTSLERAGGFELSLTTTRSERRDGSELLVEDIGDGCSAVAG